MADEKRLTYEAPRALRIGQMTGAVGQYPSDCYPSGSGATGSCYSAGTSAASGGGCGYPGNSASAYGCHEPGNSAAGVNGCDDPGNSAI